MVGVGHVEYDILMFMLTVMAFCVNAYYFPTWFKVSRGLGFSRFLRLTGWLILSSKFGYVLFTTGDILISIPSEIALCFLALGEVAVVLNRGKVVQT